MVVLTDAIVQYISMQFYFYQFAAFNTFIMLKLVTFVTCSSHQSLVAMEPDTFYPVTALPRPGQAGNCLFYIDILSQ